MAWPCLVAWICKQWNSISQCPMSKPRCGIGRCTTVVCGPSAHTAIPDRTGTHCPPSKWTRYPFGNSAAQLHLDSSSPKCEGNHPHPTSSTCHAIRSSAKLWLRVLPEINSKASWKCLKTSKPMVISQCSKHMKQLKQLTSIQSTLKTNMLD